MILMECLKNMDELEVLEQSISKPRALLDMRGSRFSLDFLEHVNAEITQWCALVGVPHGTSKSKVGDSRQ